MGIIVNDGDSKPVNVGAYSVDFEKAKSVKSGDMVSWQSSGGKAQGKVVRVVSSGKINVPDSSFTISGTADDPAVLIQLYRDGKPTETKVGHKMSTLRKSESVAKHGSHNQKDHAPHGGAGGGFGGGVGTLSRVNGKIQASSLFRLADDEEDTEEKKKKIEKHGSHDQGSHGAWSNGKYSPDDSEGEDESEPKNPKSPKKLHSHSDDSEEEYEELDADDPKWMDDMDIMRPSRITPSQRYTN